MEATALIAYSGAMFREQVKYSDQDLVDHFESRISEARLDDAVAQVLVEFAEDAEEEFALFVTAVVEGTGQQLEEEQLIDLSRTLHEAARRLDLPLPWYVRVQDEQAMSEDPQT